MGFLCEDLPQHGLVLVPFGAQDYFPLLGDIQRRAGNPVDGALRLPEQFRPRILDRDRPTSAILVNNNPKPVAALQAVWRFQTVNGALYHRSHGMLAARTLLLPFDMSEANRKRFAYWSTILPGSKRYLGESGMIGDNTDVRPPEPDEKWPGGGGVGGAGGGVTPSGGESAAQITLSLDGVFFLDGEFVGPDKDKLFEQTVGDAEAHMLVARIARDGHDKGHPPAQILSDIDEAVHPRHLTFREPPGAPEDFRQEALERITVSLAGQRKIPQYTDERAVYRIMAWTDAVLPNFRRA